MEKYKDLDEVEIDILFCNKMQGYLIKLRTRCGLNVSQAARWLGMNEGNLSRYETVANDMYTHTYLRIVNRYREKLHEPCLPEDYFILMLKKYRKELGYTKQDLAEMLNVDSSVVYRFEKEVNMHIKSYIRSCYVMGVKNLTIV